MPWPTEGTVAVESANINVKVDREVKEQAVQVLSELGLNLSTAVNMFLREVVRERRLPLDLSLGAPPGRDRR